MKQERSGRTDQTPTTLPPYLSLLFHPLVSDFIREPMLTVCLLLFSSSVGSLARTSITDAMGATSQMFAAVAFIIVTFTISFAGPIFYYLPRVRGRERKRKKAMLDLLLLLMFLL
jgi:hypothetical protein